MIVLFKKRKYAPKPCKCKKCTAPGATPVIYTPGCGPQRFAPQCLSVEKLQKAATDRDWARKKKAQSPKKLNGPNRIAAHTNRTPILRCEGCSGCSWRRPADGCPVCKLPFQEEKY